MSEMLNREVEDEVGTNSTDWEDCLSVTKTLNENSWYRMWMSAEFSAELTNKGVEMRAVLDGAVIARQAKIPKDPDEWYPFTSIKNVQLDAGEHTFKIQIRVETGSQTGRRRRVRLFVDKR